jgi:hypothetical protein
MMHSHDFGKHHHLTTMYKKCNVVSHFRFSTDRFAKTTGSEVGQHQTGWGMHWFHFMISESFFLAYLCWLCLFNNSMVVSSVCQTTSCLSQVSVTQQGRVCLISIPYSIAISKPHMNTMHHERNSYHLFMNHDTGVTC